MTSRIGEKTKAHILARWPHILGRIAGGDLIKDIMRDEGLSRGELDAFRAGDTAYQAQWERAREASADAFMDEAMEEARAKHSHLEASHVKTRIDTLKWAARIRNPRHYGEKAQLDVNVKTMDLTRIIEAANRRIIEGQALRLVGYNSGEDSVHARALPAPSDERIAVASSQMLADLL